MKVSIVPIGNSKGIRIPKPVLKQCNIGNEAILEVEGETIIIRPVKDEMPRKGWAQAFKAMHKNEEDKLLMDDFNELQRDDFQWEW